MKLYITINKIKKTKISMSEHFQNSFEKIEERRKNVTPNTHIDDLPGLVQALQQKVAAFS
jgi:hypothetical protein